MTRSDARQEVADILATYGQDLSDSAEVFEMEPPAPGEPASLVVLDRVCADLPDYCTHGYVTCVRCAQLCWLGDQTKKVVTSGEAVPICMTCANEVIPSGTEANISLKDHRRSDGPH